MMPNRWKLENMAYEISERMSDLADLVRDHEDRRAMVSFKRGYEHGHTGECYPRRICKAAIVREIKGIRKDLRDLERELDRIPGRLE